MTSAPVLAANAGGTTEGPARSPDGAPSDRASILRYRNPILPGFFPDPSVVRVDEWFYLVNSSFEMFPGVPIHRSRDLVHWEALGYVLTRDSQLPLASAGPSHGIYAPTLRHHAGTFYMVTTNVSHRGNFLVSARDPAGSWSEPVWIPGQRGIDPSLLFDDDGTVYLTSTGHPAGIYQSQLDPATGELASLPRLIWPGTGGRYPEGPHLYKIGGRYYLMISEGGTEYGHMVTVARSSSPWGPFEPCARNPILTHRNTDLAEPIQAVGHADLVEDGAGNWWLVCLGIRPQSGSYWHHLGRETFLAPVRWDAEGWPVINEGRPLSLDMQAHGLNRGPAPSLPVRDEFDAERWPASIAGLSPAWNFLRNPVRGSYSAGERPGWLVLRGTAISLDQVEGVSPTFVARRQQHLHARMATRIDFAPDREGEEAGLVLYRTPRHRYELGVRCRSGVREVFVRQSIGEYVSAVTASAPAPGTQPLLLQIDADPVRYRFAWQEAADGAVAAALEPTAPSHPLGAAETRLLSSEVTGGFIGAYVGLYAVAPEGATASPAAFDWFDYEGRG